MTTFNWLDYVIFVIILIASASIGIYYRFIDRKKSSVTELQLGGRQMTLLPVTFSIMASFMSAISVLGTTSEVYKNGVQYFLIGLSYFIAFPLAAEIFMPVLYRLKISSAHEYLERRFSPAVRMFTSVIFIIQMIFYISIVLYAPALAFSQVSGFQMWISILSIGVVCTFYTALGGIKAVMWTDFIQMMVIFVGLIVIVVWGCIRIGGPSVVWERNAAGGRLNLLNFDPNPLTRHSFWTLFIGGAFMCSSIYCSNQAQLQRYLSCKTERAARLAIWINIPLTLVFLAFLVTGGMVSYAYYFDCDPIQSGVIKKSDQIVPQLVLEIFSETPGIPGLFMAAVFSAALSTISTGINSLATVFYEDVLKFISKRCHLFKLDNDNGVTVARFIAVVFGILTVGLAFLASIITPMVLQIALSIFGMIGGPVLAIFSLGLLCPCVNKIGGLVALIAAVIVNFWVGFGSIMNPWPGAPLPTSVDGCSNQTTSFNTSTPTPILLTTTKTVVEEPSPPFFMFRISYLYYGLISCLVALIVGVSVSACTGFNTKKPVSRSLIYAPIVRFGSCFPDSWATQVDMRQHPSVEAPIESSSKHLLAETAH